MDLRLSNSKKVPMRAGMSDVAIRGDFDLSFIIWNSDVIRCELKRHEIRTMAGVIQHCPLHHIHQERELQRIVASA
jgi:hypothetical protein